MGTFSCLASELPAVHLPPVGESLKTLLRPKERAIEIQVSVKLRHYHRSEGLKMCVNKLLKGQAEPKS